MADLFGGSPATLMVLQLWQPWASAVALRSKRIETRDWETDYRGPIAISATKRRIKSELEDFAEQEHWCGALGGLALGERLDKALPFSAIIAIGRLADCRPVHLFDPAELDATRRNGGLHTGYSWTERQMGNYEPGRFGLVLEGMRQLHPPLPFTGRQAKLLPAPELAYLLRRFPDLAHA